MRLARITNMYIFWRQWQLHRPASLKDGVASFSFLLDASVAGCEDMSWGLSRWFRSKTITHRWQRIVQEPRPCPCHHTWFCNRSSNDIVSEEVGTGLGRAFMANPSHKIGRRPPPPRKTIFSGVNSSIPMYATWWGDEMSLAVPKCAKHVQL